jgi:protein-disulfide isomerase
MDSLRGALSLGTTVLLVACAVTITGLIVRRELQLTVGDGVDFRYQVLGSMDPALINDGHHLGSASAVTEILMFGDYQCPICADAAAVLRRITSADPNRLAVVYRHYPIDRFPHSKEAAVAAECAGLQGQFGAYHDALFAFQDSIGIWTWLNFAEVAAVGDMGGFESCMATGETSGRVERDRAVAERLGLPGTPAFVMNGAMFLGAWTYEEWQQIIEDLEYLGQ